MTEQREQWLIEQINAITAALAEQGSSLRSMHKRLDGLPCDEHSAVLAVVDEREHHRRRSDTWHAKVGLVLLAAGLAFAGGLASWGIQKALTPRPGQLAETLPASTDGGASCAK